MAHIYSPPLTLSLVLLPVLPLQTIAEMASKLQISVKTIKNSYHTYNFQRTTTFSSSFSVTKQLCRKHLLISYTDVRVKPRISPKCSLSSPKPPATKDEAILQAKTSLSSILEKPLNSPKLAGKMKKIKQPRFRVEIPVVDDSPASLAQLALQVFGDMPLRRKGSQIKIVIIWPSQGVMQAASEAFDSLSSDIVVKSIDMSSVLDEDVRILSSADVAVFMAPEASQLAVVKTITERLYPRAVVIFNPKWSFEEEGDFGEMKGFLGSFEVVYSFMGLEVRGILSKKKGVIFRCVRDGVLSGEKWNILVEEGEEFRLVSTFKSRPSITEVENVLYNLMAMNSPVTKSAKFLKDLVSNVTGKNK